MSKVIQLYFSGIQNFKIYYSFKTEFERLSSMYIASWVRTTNIEQLCVRSIE